MTPPPLSDVRRQYEDLKEEIDAAVAAALSSGQYILGPLAARFEEAFAAFCGAGFGIGVGNGTDAVRIALQASGVRPGDKVVTVANAGVPPVAAIHAARAEPVFVDVEADTGNLDVTALQKLTDPKVKAVLVVHLFGHPVDLQAISAVARSRDWKLIEDCSHAHGALYRGQRVGSFGDAAAFSFYPTKNLGAAGDAGIVTTNSDAIADRARLLRNYGWRSDRVSEVPSDHSRLDEIQAAVLLTKLPHLELWNAQRRALAAKYCTLLEGWVGLPVQRDWAHAVHHLFVIRTADRDGLARHLTAKGIGTGIHYAPAVYRHPAFLNVALSAQCPVTELRGAQILSLPMYPELTEAQVELVASAIKEFLGEKGRGLPVD